MTVAMYSPLPPPHPSPRTLTFLPTKALPVAAREAEDAAAVADAAGLFLGAGLRAAFAGTAVAAAAGLFFAAAFVVGADGEDALAATALGRVVDADDGAFL